MTTTSKRFLTVGSHLRPENLLQHKHEIEHRDDINYPFYDEIEGYKATEDQAVKAIVAQQVAHGLPEIADGEFSKSMWHLDFVWGFGGVRRYIKELGYQFRDFDRTQIYETRRDIGIDIVAELDGHNHPFIAHFKRLQAYAPVDANLKVCIPSPGHVFTETNFDPASYEKIYANAEAFKAGVIKAFKDFLSEYAAAGGKVLQFDDCLWQLYAEDNEKSPFTGKGTFNEAKAKEQASAYVDINNQVIDFGHELGLRVYTHNCRGNYDSRSMADGSYKAIANYFLEQQHYDRFYLEWDDERAGDLSALSAFADKPETEVVLGLLSSKTATLDDEERALSSLAEAAKYVAKDRLYLSHQCGFASCDCGNQLTAADEWAKIKQGQAIAHKFWGE